MLHAPPAIMPAAGPSWIAAIKVPMQSSQNGSDSLSASLLPP